MCNLFQKTKFIKKEQKILCPYCSTSFTIRYGFYYRAYPQKSIQVSIQRYRCNSPKCPRKTFSVLPYPFLPILRHFYHTLLFCYSLYRNSKLTQADGARKMSMPRGTFKRLRTFCKRFIPWFDGEREIACWNLHSNVVLSSSWADFTRYFSQSFYPKRWKVVPPTEYIPMNY